MTPRVTLTLLTAGWCGLHSLLIAMPVTEWLRGRLGPRYRVFRLVFNLIALATFVPLVYYQLRVGGEVLFGWPGWWWVPRAALIGAAGALFVAGSRKYDLLQFVGLRQLAAGAALDGGAGGGELDTSGIQGYVRHPWYLGTLLLIWTRTLDWSVIVFNAVLSVHLVVGTVLEERKLVVEFGERYRQYQRQVPMLIPRRRRSAPERRR